MQKSDLKLDPRRTPKMTQLLPCKRPLSIKYIIISNDAAINVPKKVNKVCTVKVSIADTYMTMFRHSNTDSYHLAR